MNAKHIKMIIGAAVATVVTAGQQQSSAADYYWVKGGVDAATDGAWNQTEPNWATSVSGAGGTWPTSGTNHVARFQNAPAAGSVTIDVANQDMNPDADGYNLKLASLRFVTTGYTIQSSEGALINLNGSGLNRAILLASGVTGTIGSGVTLYATNSNTLEDHAYAQNAGTLRLEGGSLQALFASEIHVTKGATLEVATGGLVGGRVINASTGVITASASNNTLSVGGDNQGNGTLLVTGGTVDLRNASGNETRNLNIGKGTNAGNGTVTLTSGSILLGGQVTANSTSALVFGGSSGPAGKTGTFNLDGGVFSARQVREGSTSGTSIDATFNFNGGVLQANASDSAGGGATPGSASYVFFAGLDRANVLAGGAVIDTQDFDIGINQPLLHVEGDAGIDGGLTKLGSGSTGGTLRLSGVNTYNGATTVEAGTLIVEATGTLGIGEDADVNVLDSSTLTLRNAAAIDDLATLTLADGAMLNLDFASGLSETVYGLTIGSTIFGPGTYSSADSDNIIGTGSIHVVPEPTSLAVVGLAGLTLLTRRRRLA